MPLQTLRSKKKKDVCNGGREEAEALSASSQSQKTDLSVHLGDENDSDELVKQSRARGQSTNHNPSIKSPSECPERQMIASLSSAENAMPEH